MFGKAFKATFGVGCALVVGLIALVIISGVLANGARDVGNVIANVTLPPSSTRVTSPTPARAWVAVNQWSGDGKKDTEKFTVGDEWRIDWVFTSSNDFGAMFVSVYDDAAHIVGIAVSTQKTGSDSSFQHKAGTYYLSINGANGNWKVAVQDMR